MESVKVMRRTAKVSRGCVWALAAAAALIALVPFQCIHWDGGFPNVECRLKFVDGEGKPVPGVTLTVFTKGGTACHFYPIDEFVSDQPVVSDAKGQMVLHHSTEWGLEFGGREYQNLLGMRFGETTAPQYDCVFTHNGREVFRTPFNFYKPEWREFRKPAVTRQWSPPWNENTHGPLPAEDFDAWERRVYGGKSRAQMDREERTAAGSFQRQFFREPKVRETKFLVVDRTIVIQSP